MTSCTPSIGALNLSPARPGRTAVRALLATAAATALFSVAGLPALAAPVTTASGTTTANVVVESAITLTGLTSSFTLTGIPLSTVTGAAAVTMNVYTNNLTGYAVTVGATVNHLNGARVGNTDVIPLSALSVRETGTTPYTPLADGGTPSTVTVHNQNTPSANAGDTINNDFQVAIPRVAPDTYTQTLTYTAAAKA